MATQVIGACKCPVCSSHKASLRLSAKQLVYVHCNTCHFQGFARGDLSDTKLRALLIETEAEAEPALEAPVATAAAAPIAAVPAPMPPAKPKANWGMPW